MMEGMMTFVAECFSLEEMKELQDACVLTSTERKLDRVLGEYIDSFEKEMGRPHHIMNRMWQMMQSRDTWTLNLDKDFEEIMSKVKQAGRN